MATFPAFLGNFEMYPQKGAAYEFLSPLLGQLNRVDFVLRVADPLANQGQMDSNLDESLENDILALPGVSSVVFQLPPGIPQELDFAFRYADQTVAVEIEKANREKFYVTSLNVICIFTLMPTSQLLRCQRTIPTRTVSGIYLTLVSRDSKSATLTDSVMPRTLGVSCFLGSNSSTLPPMSLYPWKRGRECVLMQLAGDSLGYNPRGAAVACLADTALTG